MSEVSRSRGNEGYGACSDDAPFSVPKSQPSASGCDLERRSGEMSDFSRLRGNKRYAARDDLGAPPVAAL